MENVDEVMSDSSSVKKRGFWLVAFLSVGVLSSLFSAFIYFFANKLLFDQFPNLSLPLLYFMGAVCLFSLVSCFATLKWKKWGVFGYVLVTVISLIFNLYIGLPIFQTLMGILGIFILYFLIRKKWHHFT